MNLTSIGIKITAAFALVLLAFAIFAGVAFREILSSSATERLVSKSHEVISQIVQMHASTSEIQSAVRGFTLTGDEELAESVEWNRLDLLQGLEELRSLTVDNPDQRTSIARLVPLVDKFLSIHLLQVERRRKDGMEGAVELAKSGEGQQATEAILAALDDMKDVEDSLLESRTETARESVGDTRRYLILSAMLTIGFGLGASAFITRRIVTPVARLVEGTERIGGGDFDHRVPAAGSDEIGQLGAAFNEMVARLQQSHETVARQDWLKGCLVRIGSQLQGQRDVSVAGRIVLAELADALAARHGALYLKERSGDRTALALRASYGCGEGDRLPVRIHPGEGLVGQCLVEKQRLLLTDVPPGYLRIHSALGDSAPDLVVLQPAIFEGEVEAVLELASFQKFEEVQFALLDQLAESLAVALHTIQTAQQTEDLLHESQSLAAKLEENARQLRERNEEVERKNAEVEEARLALQERAEQLARSNADLEQFAHVASHDLQEPLRAVAGFASLLERHLQSSLDEQSRDYFQHIIQGANRMKSLIADLLAFSRVNRGDSFQETDCEEVLQAVLQNLEASVSSSNATITHDPLPTVWADRTQMVQILQNLISNAIKFAGKETPAVHVGAAQQSDGSWMFSVRDNGIGIPPEFAERIFVIFQRLHTREQYPGTGIGLAICKKIAERHRGSIWVESEPGKGATFFFTIATQTSTQTPP